MQSVDQDGILVNHETFRRDLSLDGRDMLIIDGPAPDGYSGEPLPFGYIISPNKDKVASIGLSNVHDLDAFGYQTVADRSTLLRYVLESVKF